MARFRCPQCNTFLPAGGGRVTCPSCGIGVRVPDQPPAPEPGGAGPWMLAGLIAALLLLTGGAVAVTYVLLSRKPEAVAKPKDDPTPKGDPTSLLWGDPGAKGDPALKGDPKARIDPSLLDFRKTYAEPGFLPADSSRIISVRAAELWEAPGVQKAWAALSPKTQAGVIEFNRRLGTKMVDYERVTGVAHEKGAWLVLRTVAPLDRERLAAMLSGAGQGMEWKPETHEGMTYFVGKRDGASEGEEPFAVFPASPRLFVAGKRAGVRQALALQAAGVKDGPLAFAVPSIEGGKSHVVLATALAPAGLMPASMAKLGAVLVEGKQSPDRQAVATARFPNAKGEDDGGLLGGLGKLGGGLLDVVKPGSAMGDVLEKATGIRFKPVPGGTAFEATLDADLVAKLVADAFGQVKLDGLEALGGFKNLTALALALEAFHEANGHYPQAAYSSPEGKPLYGWRVAILPYLGDDGKKLYEAFDRTRAWDEGPNKALTAALPPAFAHPMVPADRAGNVTVFQLPVGPKAVFDAARKPTRRDVGESAKTTVMLLVTRKAVPWAAPADIAIPAAADAAQSLVPDLGFLPDGDIEALLFDGSPRLLPRKMTGAELLKAVDPRTGTALPPS